MKILHGPNDTAGLAVSMAKYERKIGLESDALLFNRQKLGSQSYENHDFIKVIDMQNCGLLPGVAKRFKEVLPKLKEYDIIDLTFGKSFFMMPYLGVFVNELAYLKSLGKKISITYQGCDIRLPSMAKKSKYNACKHCSVPSKYFYDSDNWEFYKKLKIDLFEKYCDLIFYHNPDIGNYVNKGVFRPYMKVDYREWIPINKEFGKKIIIGHAPSNRETKGTKFVLEAMEKLGFERSDFELKLIENIRYSEIKDFYNDIDLFVDQLNFGWYGGASVEMMALGKPVVCYLNEKDFKYVPENFMNDLPIINANKDNLHLILDDLLNDRDRLKQHGKMSRDFAIEYHDPIKIAKFMKEQYESLFRDNN